MRTPEGWARANLLLETLRAPPPKGSLQESALILLLMKLESIEHARFRALAQITVDKDKGVEAFEEYMKIAFPYLDAAKRRDRKEFTDLLQQEIMRGPLRVIHVAQKKVRSRLKDRYVKRQAPRPQQELNQLYSKMGRLIDER